MVVVCEDFRDGGVAPTNTQCALVFCLCGSPALGAMGGGLQGLSRRWRRSYKKCLGMRTAEEPSPMRWAPTKKPVTQKVREKLTEGVSSLSSLLQQR